MGSRVRQGRNGKTAIIDRLTLCTVSLQPVPLENAKWYRTSVGIVVGIYFDSQGMLSFVPAALPLGTIFRATFRARVLPLEAAPWSAKLQWFDAAADLKKVELAEQDGKMEQMITFPLNVNRMDRTFTGALEVCPSRPLVVRSCWLEVVVS